MATLVVPAAVERMLAPKCLGRPGWLETLPARIDSYARRWQLDMSGAKIASGHNACIVHCTDAREEPLVLKLVPDPGRARAEAEALVFWQAAGVARSVAVLRLDPSGGALLLERVVPGDHLRADEGAIPLVAGALAEIHGSPARGARRWLPLADALRTKWRAQLSAFERLVAVGLVSHSDLDWVCARIEELLATASGDAVVLHADLHEPNVLVCRRRGAVLIDPRPYVGERAYDVATWLAKQRDVAGIEDAASEFAAQLSLCPRRILAWSRAKALRTASIVHCMGGSEEQVEELIRFALRQRRRAPARRPGRARASFGSGRLRALVADLT